MESLKRFDEAFKKLEERFKEYKNSSGASASLSLTKALQYFRTMRQKSHRILQNKRTQRIKELQNEFDSQSILLTSDSDEEAKASIIDLSAQPIVERQVEALTGLTSGSTESESAIQEENTDIQGQSLAECVDLSAKKNEDYTASAGSDYMNSTIFSDIQCALKTKRPSFKGLIRESLYLRKSISFTESDASVKTMIGDGDDSFEYSKKVKNTSNNRKSDKHATLEERNEVCENGNEKIRYSKEFLTRFFVNLKKRNDVQFSLDGESTEKTDNTIKSDGANMFWCHKARCPSGNEAKLFPKFSEYVLVNTEPSKPSYPVFTNMTIDRRKVQASVRMNAVLKAFKKKHKVSAMTNASSQKLISPDISLSIRLMKERDELYSKLCDQNLKKRLENIDGKLFKSISGPFPVIDECIVDGRSFVSDSSLKLEDTVHPELKDILQLEDERISAIVERYFNEDGFKKSDELKKKMVQLLKKQDFKSDLLSLTRLTRVGENEPNSEMVEKLLLVLNRGDIYTDLRLINILDRTIETLSKSKDPFTCKVAINMAICKKYVEDFAELKKIVEEFTSLKL